MSKADWLLSVFTRRRTQGEPIAQVVAPLCDPDEVACLSQDDRLSVWRRVWWYGRDPRLCLLLRDSGCWNDAQFAWRLLSKGKDAHLLSEDLMELSLPQSRNLPLEHWHAHAIAAVSDLGLDKSTRFLWAAVHALPPSPDRQAHAMTLAWPEPVEHQAIQIVVNKWVLSGQAELSPVQQVWRTWMSAHPRRLALFGAMQTRRMAFEKERAFGEQRQASLDCLDAGMRRFLLEAAANSASSLRQAPAGPRSL